MVVIKVHCYLGQSNVLDMLAKDNYKIVIDIITPVFSLKQIKRRFNSIIIIMKLKVKVIHSYVYGSF